MPTEFHHSGLCCPLVKFMGVDSCTVLFLRLSNVVYLVNLYSENKEYSND